MNKKAKLASMAYFQIAVLITATIAFAFLMNVQSVSAIALPLGTSLGSKLLSISPFKASSPTTPLRTGIPGVGPTFGAQIGSLTIGAVYAAGISYAIMQIGDWIDKDFNKHLAAWTGGAAFAGTLGGLGAVAGAVGATIPTGATGLQIITTRFSEGFQGIFNPTWGMFGIALVTGILIFAITESKQDKQETIQFKCMAWQAPIKGNDCDRCNTDPLKPCSEYRCKALGQSCGVINVGTSAEKCIWMNPHDTTSPGIKPDKEILKSGYAYADVKERPAGGKSGTSGMKIVDANTGGCLKAFNAFTFGIITTDTGDKTQPAQCKIEYNHTASFDEMRYFMGDENKFVEKHSQLISLPNTDTLNATFPGVKNDGEYTLYIRCKDGNGNKNEDEFAVRFCIDKGPDLSAPEIKSTSVPSNSPVLYQIDKLSGLKVYTNEPANCRWSRKNADYANMENQMTCSNKLWEINTEMLYTCTTELTGIKDKEENDFYFRCQDTSPQNNTMQQSYEYTLFGTQPLTILSTGPNGTIGSSTTTAIVNLTVKTDNGYKNGQASCEYSLSENIENYVPMFESGGTNIHNQPLDLTEGDYNVKFKCFDAGGNTEYSQTSFSIFVDKSAPQIVRSYNQENKIKVVTDEESTCRYSTDSCNFDLSKGEGIDMLYPMTKEHYAEWKMGQAYYVKCMDGFNNQPAPDGCSIILRPFELPQTS